MHALRKRAESDLSKLKFACTQAGYLGADVSFTIKRLGKPTVIFSLHLGHLYTIKIVQILPSELYGQDHNIPDLYPPFQEITPQALGVEIGAAAKAQTITSIEKNTTNWFRKKGFAFAKVSKKTVVGDALDHSVSITCFVDTGPKVVFGETSIYGSKRVDPDSIQKFITWRKGDIYNPEKIEETQSSLENSGLFSAVLIEENSEKYSDGKLPVDIHLSDAKHKSIRAGINYTTSKGPGVIAEWEDRNVRKSGNKFSAHAEVWKKFQNIKFSFIQPNFYAHNQDLNWSVEYDKKDTIGFFSKSISGESLIERTFSADVDGYMGAKLEQLHARSPEEGNHLFYLAKAPMQLKWKNFTGSLDPLSGFYFGIKLTPAYQFYRKNFLYLAQTTHLAGYTSLYGDAVTLAAKVTFGNIFGAARHTIPIPDRFFSGSENALRGYRYLSVSPLNHGKPSGGRSLLTGSAEARFRTPSGFGWVFFYDVGNVFSENFPVFDQKMLSSIGIGGRYSTPVGPFRLDIAFPLNRRHKIDPPFQIYFSVGQAF